MSKTAVLAFSGGLDTSFCVPYLIDQGRTPETLGLWLGTWGMGCSLFGSVVGGLLALRLRLLHALALTACLRVVPHAAQWALAVAGEPDIRR